MSGIDRIKRLCEIAEGYHWVKGDQKNAILQLASMAYGKLKTSDPKTLDNLKDVALQNFVEGQDGYGAIMELAVHAKVGGLRLNPPDGSDRYYKARQEAADCVTSLHEAVQQAGGTVSDEYLDLTVREFIGKIAAQNNIRFTYKGTRR